MAVTAASAVASAALLVIKVGSSLLVDPVTGQSNGAWLATLAADIAQIRSEGRRVIVVSSGAVALGRARLGLARRTRPRLDEQQAAAAAGQSRLMRAWEEALEPHGLVAAQLLLTAEDTENRTRWLNARATVETLLAAGAVPVVNENDTVATDEIRYGDNDRLAARVAQMAQADTLLLLSDIDGLYTADPRTDPAAEHLGVVDRLTPRVMAMGSGPNAEAQVGSGGMATKLQAAAIARSAGCATVITLGSRAKPVSAVAAGARATLVNAGAGPLAAYKQWIAGALKPRGVLTVDDGAAAALMAGRSLLPSGVSGADGAFRKGDCVLVRDRAGVDIAMGLVNFSQAEVVRILGRRTEELEPLLGYRSRSEVVHRDDLVEFSGQARRAS